MNNLSPREPVGSLSKRRKIDHEVPPPAFLSNFDETQCEEAIQYANVNPAHTTENSMDDNSHAPRQSTFIGDDIMEASLNKTPYDTPPVFDNNSETLNETLVSIKLEGFYKSKPVDDKIGEKKNENESKELTIDVEK